ncbi:beta-lactamase family protein [Kitasatospora sp. NBC_01250]|uniref:serine hydrolase domain-containing protein n=1 Tax=unclassified Kitasatospora TaxID=2633591 RepID=UPI002E14ED41|nr:MULTISPECIES: serine hydrolase domain-containing protein [unclassified Kitasatospora]WSJ65248.1 beta-lactamase family protein [Kitasatospora sp. NBC_01302]
MPLALVTALAGPLALCTTASATAAGPAPSSASAAWRVRLAELVRQDVAAGAPGVAVRVDEGGGQVLDIAQQAPWSRADHRLGADDEFKMGSNTKTMVATVVLQLVAERRISLTDPVSRWLPGLIPDGEQITVRMLLDHTSGLFNYANDPAVLRSFTGQDTRSWSPRQLIAAAVQHPALFAPGTRYSYSNTNYVALGLVAEQASGQGIADLIRQRITQPLHLTHTHLDTGGGTSTPGSPNLAHGYEPDAAHLAPVLPPGTPPGSAFAGPERPDGYVDTTATALSTEWAAGGMVSTAGDWARFDRALLSGKLLPSAQLKEMETTVSEGPDTANRYGLGLEQVVTPCGTVWGHDGQVPGYSSEEYTDPTGHRTVSVFTTTVFGIAQPPAAAADHAVVDAAVCAMLHA